MYRKRWFLGLVLGFLFISTNLFPDDIKARTIMQKVDDRDDGKTIQQDILMVLIGKNGKKRKEI